jgi:hypothetical protein
LTADATFAPDFRWRTSATIAPVLRLKKPTDKKRASLPSRSHAWRTPKTDAAARGDKSPYRPKRGSLPGQQRCGQNAIPIPDKRLIFGPLELEI